MFWRIIFTLLLCGAWAACSYEHQPWQPQQFGSELTFQVPPYIEKTTELSDKSPLQFVNFFRNFYMVVDSFPLHSAADSSLATLAQNEVADLKTHLFEPVSSPLRVVQQQPHPTLRCEVEGTVGTEKKDLQQAIRYYFYFVEGKQHRYRILVWIWADRRNFHEQEIEKLLASVRLQ